jgi:hypothetical protein
MFFDRWKQQISDNFIFDVGDGRLIFYPYGPFRGYFVPRPEFKPLIVKSIFWFNLTAIATALAAYPLWVVLNLEIDTVLCVGCLLGYGHYHLRTRRVTRKLVPLPSELSLRLYARCRGLNELGTHVISSLFMGAIFATIGFVQGSFFSWIVILIVSYHLAGAIAAIRAHSRETRRIPEPIERSKSSVN